MALCLWLTWENHLITRTRLMANGKHPSRCISSALTFRSKSYRNLQNLHTSSTPYCQHFQTQQPEGKEGERKKGKKRKETKVQPPKTVPLCLQCVRIRVSRMTGLLSPFLLQTCLWAGTCKKHTCVPIIFICVCNQNGAWWQFIGDVVYTYCVHI